MLWMIILVPGQLHRRRLHSSYGVHCRFSWLLFSSFVVACVIDCGPGGAARAAVFFVSSVIEAKIPQKWRASTSLSIFFILRSQDGKKNLIGVTPIHTLLLLNPQPDDAATEIAITNHPKAAAAAAIMLFFDSLATRYISQLLLLSPLTFTTTIPPPSFATLTSLRRLLHNSTIHQSLLQLQSSILPLLLCR